MKYLKYVKSWHTVSSGIGGGAVGFGIVTAFDRLGWGGILLLPIFAIALFLVLMLPFYIEECRDVRKFKKDWKASHHDPQA